GGLLDCTNTIKSPLCAVITTIGLDHTAILGDTIEKISTAKMRNLQARLNGGHFKAGYPCNEGY
ncbi:folylpolyglutamate synthase, partial [human gut metagenome]